MPACGILRPMDPAIAGLIGAGVVSAVGIVTAVLTRRGEHQKWLREERLKAYGRLIEAASDMTGSKASPTALTCDNCCPWWPVNSGLRRRRLRGPAWRKPSPPSQTNSFRPLQRCASSDPPSIDESTDELQVAALAHLLVTDSEFVDPKRFSTAETAFLNAARRGLRSHR